MSPSTIILALLLAILIGSALASLRGSRDACEQRGGTPHGFECQGGRP